jgi:outer membrane protein
MKRISLIAATMLVTIASSAYASADAAKIGIVNIDLVLQQSPLAMSYNEKISKEFKPRQEALNAAQKKLQADLDQLTFSGFQMNNDDRTKLRNSINDEKRAFDTMNASMQQDLQAMQNKYTQELLGKLGNVINKMAKDGKYDIVQTNSNLLYINSAVDVTADIIKQLQ